MPYFYAIMDIKNRLNDLRSLYNRPEFIQNDPIQFVHQFKNRKDQEVVAFLIATITWGKRPLILKSANRILQMMENNPYGYIMRKKYLAIDSCDNIHRTFFEDDFVYFCKGLHQHFRQSDSLEATFSNERDLWDGIVCFRETFVQANKGIESKHISNPLKNSACKRLHMALRWLVRNDGIVDLGIWKNISPSQLFIPLDTHVANVSRELGLLTRKSNDKKAVEELTANLREIDSNDPIAYDFALFGLGEARASGRI